MWNPIKQMQNVCVCVHANRGSVFKQLFCISVYLKELFFLNKLKELYLKVQVCFHFFLK